MADTTIILLVRSQVQSLRELRAVYFEPTTVNGVRSCDPKVSVQWIKQTFCSYKNTYLFDKKSLRKYHLRVVARRNENDLTNQ